MGCIKVCITGPESTGKSELTLALTQHYKVPFTLEFARTYLANLEGKYTAKDLEAIAKGQLEQNLKAIEKARKEQKELAFLDTDLLTIDIWSKDKLGMEIPFVREGWLKNKPDLYLLCFPDLPWQPDALREDEHRLNELFGVYKERLEKENCNFLVIRGQGPNRLLNAINAVEIFKESFQ